MATSIISNFTSTKFYPVANPINITVNSTNSGNCNFRYICDIYINGTRVFRDKLFPDPSTGYGFFQIGRIIQDYTTFGVPVTTLTTGGFSAISSSTYPNTMLSVYCKIGEEYDTTSDCSGSVNQYLSLVTSNTFYAFNGVVDYEDFPTWNYGEYLMGTASWGSSIETPKFLTNSPRTIEVGFDDSYYLNFYSTTQPTVGDIVIYIVTYYKGVYVNEWEIPCGAINAYRHYRIACGPYNINKYFGVPLPLTQAVDKYTVFIRNTAYGNPPQKSEIFTFKLKEPAENKTRIGFIGLLGNTEYYNFHHRNKLMLDIERKNFKKVLQSNYSGVWKYNVGDRVDTTYAVKAQEKHTVASYVSRDTPEWLGEMFLSPEVWVNKGPKVLCFHVYPEQVFTGGGGSGGGDPTDRIGPVTSGTTRMLFVLGPDHGLVVGDQFYCYPENVDEYIDYNNLFTVTELIGEDTVDCGVTFGVYNLTNYVEGFIVKREDWVRYPIVITDNTFEEKIKVSKPIEYTLSYMMAYGKNTLR